MGGIFVLALAAAGQAAAAAPTAAAPVANVALEGELKVLVEDYADHSRTRHFLDTSHGRVELLFDRVPPSLHSGQHVRVRGTGTRAVHDAGTTLLALDGAQVSSLETSAMTLTGTLGQQNTAVILVNFQDDASQPMMPAEANSLVFGMVGEYFLENSFKQTWVGGTTFGWITIPMSKTVCDPTNLATLATNAVAAAGYSLANYPRKVFMFPRNACTWSGLGEVGGSATQAWINGRFDTQVVAHEMGHNFGLRHARALNCDTGSLGNTCTTLEYGDVADDMGNIAAAHYSPFAKELLGWLNDGVSPPILTAATSGRYVIQPYSSSDVGAKAIKIPRGVDAAGRKLWYYVEFRQPIGADMVLNVGNLTQGVILRTATEGDATTSVLLDMTPGSYPTENTREMQDGALALGRSYSDANAGVTISVASLTSTAAAIDVSFAGSTSTCVRTAPSITLTGPTAAVAAGTAQTYSFTLVNRDSSACSAGTFAIAGSVPSGWSGSLATSSLSVSAGASVSSSFTVTSAATAAAGTYGIGVAASNTASGTAQASATYSVATAATATLSESVATDKTSYLRGDLVYMTAKVLSGGLPVSGASVSFRLSKADGSVAMLSGVSDSNGYARAKLRLNKQKDPVGTYQLAATATSGSRTANASAVFSVN